MVELEVHVVGERIIVNFAGRTVHNDLYERS